MTSKATAKVKPSFTWNTAKPNATPAKANAPIKQCPCKARPDASQASLQKQTSVATLEVKMNADDAWANRVSGRRCGRCMYWSAKPDARIQQDGQNRDNVQGRCKRNAPTNEGYPITFITEWCGQFRLA